MQKTLCPWDMCELGICVRIDMLKYATRSYPHDCRQALYFDRYTRLLAPELDPLRDDRVTLPNEYGRADAGLR